MGFWEILFTTGRSAANTAVTIAPVPSGAAAVLLLTTIIELCERVPYNKGLARELKARCELLQGAIQQRIASKSRPSELTDDINEISSALGKVEMEMKKQARMRWIRAFLYSKENRECINKCTSDINQAIEKFQVGSTIAIRDSQAEIKDQVESGNNETKERLSKISETQDVMAANVVQLMVSLQNSLTGKPADDPSRKEAETELYELSTKYNTLLPSLHLNRGEVERLGSYAVDGTPTMDIWEGRYLMHQKVAIKIIRAATSDENSDRRFLREVKIWGEIWKRDLGNHILQFLGFCTNDGPYPYTVSPWMENGTAIKYVIANDSNVHYPAFIRRIAQGVAILHSHTPPVVHGDIRGANIVVNPSGQPLLSDFGVSQIVEDITGVPYTQSHGVADALRWCAPEVLSGPDLITTSVDIYAFAMTVLELLTHKKPFAEFKHASEMTVKAVSGVRPKRPTDPAVISRGLDDKLWKLLSRCWATEPEDRPTIEQVVAELS